MYLLLLYWCFFVPRFSYKIFIVEAIVKKWLKLYSMNMVLVLFVGKYFICKIMGKNKDVKTKRRKDGVFLWDVEELTFLIIFLHDFYTICYFRKPFVMITKSSYFKFKKLVQNNSSFFMWICWKKKLQCFHIDIR